MTKLFSSNVNSAQGWETLLLANKMQLEGYLFFLRDKNQSRNCLP